MKVHIAIDGAGGVVLSVVITGSDVLDGSVAAEVMEGVNAPVRQVIADGGYD